jgi:hypothetical protein
MYDGHTFFFFFPNDLGQTWIFFEPWNKCVTGTVRLFCEYLPYDVISVVEKVSNFDRMVSALKRKL